MADDNPTHVVIIETLEDGTELRRLGPMHLGRAYTVKAKLENVSINALTERARIADSPDWDFENNRERKHVDSDTESGGETDGG